MTEAVFYKKFSHIKLEVSMSEYCRDLDTAEKTRDMIAVTASVAGLYDKWKKARQIDFFMAYGIGRGANMFLHSVCKKASKWADSDSFQVQFLLACNSSFSLTCFPVTGVVQQQLPVEGFDSLQALHQILPVRD
jgi:hypothetical protein